MTTELEDIDFAQLIGNRDIDVCELIEDMNEDGIASALYSHAYLDVKGRWPEAESYIMKDPHLAYYYACDVIEDRWIEAEPHIMKHAYRAYCYAKDIIKGRWPEAEPYIMKDPVCAHYYSNHFGIKL